MRPAVYLITASVSFIMLLEAAAMETFVPVWLNDVISAVACVVALLIALDGRERKLGKEK